MPLKQGSSQSVIKTNIDELMKANKGRKRKRSQKQIVAIALNKAKNG